MLNNTLYKYLGKYVNLSRMAEWDIDSINIFRAKGRGKIYPEFKTLLSSICRNECRYCIFRKYCHIYRGKWNKDKLISITLKLWNKGKIKGLFLSSSIYSDPEKVVEDQLEVVRGLRKRGFEGFIHLRIMPGTPKWIIYEAIKYVDRIGVNIETPDPSIFYSIAPDKGSYRNDILKVLEYCSLAWKDYRSMGLLKNGVSTQMIVGIGENDLQILETTFRLVREMGLRRVYYSPFRPVPGTPMEKNNPCPKTRVKLLYQAFYLIRDYGFTIKDFNRLLNEDKMLITARNLKKKYAEINRYIFPINLNNEKYYNIVKVPGIGPSIAREILYRRRYEKITPKILEEIMGRNIKKVLKYVDF